MPPEKKEGKSGIFMIPLETGKVHDKIVWDWLTQQGENFKARGSKQVLDC